jgi:methylated-DNA-[protein]-cysteine S-methyltransferase
MIKKTTPKAIAKSYVYKMMRSPVGDLKLVGSERGLAAILWKGDSPRRVRLNISGEDKKQPILVKAEAQLNEYFAGKRKKFALKLDFNGTQFQKKVWAALLDIPFGETVSYGDIAKKVGSPKAVRAVGAASGKNPISIIAACHRVIGSSGKLTGYAGGMKAKVHLLEHEGGRISGKPHAGSRVSKTGKR